MRSVPSESKVSESALVAWTREIIGERDIAFDARLVHPPAALSPRLRKYALVFPQHGGEMWTLGADDLRHVRAIFVVVLFTDVAVDYYLRSDLMPALRRRIDTEYGLGTCTTDRYMTALKELATLARLGRIGRNGLFFSRRFGFNCKIDAAFLTVAATNAKRFDGVPKAWQLGACSGCDLCVRACPVSAYEDFRLHDPAACERHITPDWARPERMCRACITSCPASERMLSRCHADGAHHRLIHESARRAVETFVLDPQVTSHGGQLYRAGVPITLPPNAAEGASWLAHRTGPFTMAGFAEAAPRFPRGRIRALFSVLRRKGILALAGDVPPS